MAVILAGVWGGPYDCRLLMPFDEVVAAFTRVDGGGNGDVAIEPQDVPSVAHVADHVQLVSPSAELHDEYLSLMADLNLGDFDITGSMMSAIVPKMPEAMGELAGVERKKAFIGLMLPTVIIALDEVRQERQLLMAILTELGCDEDGLSFSEEQPDWQYQLGPDKVKFILALTRKYRTTSAHELVDKVNILPPSLILAQGAIESGWGASRIALDCNNLFGMYVGIVSSSSERSSELRVIEYDTILDSVRAYILNLNRQSAYKTLREIRLQTLDPMRIAEGLTQYSERKALYIADVKLIIELNRLQHYDALILTAG